MKGRQEDQEKREERPSQGDESVRPHDLEIIHPTTQTKPNLFLLSV
jgi:hypothetical protein